MLFDMSALAARRLLWVLAAAALVVTGTFGFFLGGVEGGPGGFFVEEGIVERPPLRVVPDYRATYEIDCDQLLRNQLVFQRNASDADRLNLIIETIQNQRADQCALEYWNPVIVDPADGPDGPHCWLYSRSSGGWSGLPPVGGVRTVGGFDVPARLIDERVGDVQVKSGRDRDNSIIVYFSDPGVLPTDGASCWLYDSRLSRWSHQ